MSRSVPRAVAASLVLAAVLAGGASAADRVPLALSPGPHAVGFRLFNQRDAARRLADGSLRPVQVAVWYPAASDDRVAPFRYRDYVLVAARERTLFAPGPAAAEQALDRYRVTSAATASPPPASRMSSINRCWEALTHGERVPRFLRLTPFGSGAAPAPPPRRRSGS